MGLNLPRLALSAALTLALVMAVALGFWLIAACMLLPWFAITGFVARDMVREHPSGIEHERFVWTCRSLSTEQLLDMHDEGQTYENQKSPAAFGDQIMQAIEAVLEERGTPLCTCGAPRSDGVHMISCQES